MSEADFYWTYSARELLGHLMRAELASIRPALKGSRFETMDDRELALIISTALTNLREPGVQ